MAADVFVEPIAGAGGTRGDWFVVEVMADVGGPFERGSVAAIAGPFDGFESDPNEIAAELADGLGWGGPARLRCGGGGSAAGADFGAGVGRIVFPKMAEEFIKTKVFPFGYIKGQSAGQKLVKDDAQRIDIGPGVNVVNGWISLLGAHVAGSADE